MRTGSTLLIQSSEGMEPLGAFNQPVYHNLSQLRESLARKFGPDMAGYFARPDIDPGGARIAWTAAQVGEPRRWIDLSPDEQAALEPIKQAYQSRLATYQAELGRAPHNSPSHDLSLVLKQALQVPGPEFLYFLGGKPVVVFWGFKRVGVPEGIDPLLLEPQTVRLATGTPVSPPIGGAPPRVAAPPIVPIAIPWWRRLWWLWWLLGLLLLLLLLLCLLQRLLPRYAVTVPFWPTTVQEQPVPVQPTLPRMVPVVPGGTSLPDVPTEAVPSEGVPVIPSGTVPGGVPPAGDVMPVAPDNRGGPPHTPGTPDLPSVPDHGLGSDHAGATERKEGLATPAARSKTGANGEPKDGSHGDSNKPPAASTAPSKPLALPPQAKAGPAAFMEGAWRSRSGLIDPKGHPLEETYHFDKSGKGQVTIRSQDGRTCTGSADATTSADGTLRVGEAPVLTCSNGETTTGAVTTCKRGADGVAECNGRNQSDGSTFGVQMEHLDAR